MRRPAVIAAVASACLLVPAVSAGAADFDWSTGRTFTAPNWGAAGSVAAANASGDAVLAECGGETVAPFATGVIASLRPAGGTWGPVQALKQDGHFVPCQQRPVAAVEPDGDVVVAFTGDDGQVHLATYSQQTMAWSYAVTGDATMAEHQQSPNIAMKPNGDALVVYQSTSNYAPSHTSLRTIEHTSAGWGGLHVVWTSADEWIGQILGFDSDAAGNAGVVFQRYYQDQPTTEFFQYDAAGGTWASPVTMSTIARTNPAYVSLGSDGTVRLAWQNYGPVEMHKAPGGSWSTPVALAGVPEPDGYMYHDVILMHVAYSADGHALAVFRRNQLTNSDDNNPTSETNVAVATDDGAGNWTPLTNLKKVDENSANTAGLTGAMGAIDNSGRAVVAFDWWESGTFQDIKAGFWTVDRPAGGTWGAAVQRDHQANGDDNQFLLDQATLFDGGGGWLVNNHASVTSLREWVDNQAPTVSIAVKDGEPAPRIDHPIALQATATDDFDTPDVAWDFDGDGFDDGAGTTASPSFGTPGHHVVKARATDSKGLFTVAQIDLDVADDPAAVITVTDRPPASTTATTAHIAFTTDDAADPIMCTLDGSLINPCGSPLDLTGLGAGQHTVQIWQTDSGGHTGSATVAWDVTSTTTGATAMPGTGDPSPPTGPPAPGGTVAVPALKTVKIGTATVVFPVGVIGTSGASTIKPFTIGCRAACTGRILKPSLLVGSGAKKAFKLATSTFKVTAGGTAAPAVKLSKPAKSALGKAKRATLVLPLQLKSGGTSAKKTLKLPLKP